MCKSVNGPVVVYIVIFDATSVGCPADALDVGCPCLTMPPAFRGTHSTGVAAQGGMRIFSEAGFGFGAWMA